jgi:hypothetical protein
LGDGACASVAAVIDNFSFDSFKGPTTTTTTSAAGALRYDNEELVFDAGPIFDEEPVFDGESSPSTRFDSPSPFDSYSFTLPQTPAELVDEPNHDEASPLSLVHDDWADLYLQTGSCPECSRCCLLLLNCGTDEGGNLQSQHSTTSQLLNSGYLFEQSAQPWEERDFGIPYATAPSAAVSSNDEVEAVVAREIHGEVTGAEVAPQQPWRLHACVQRNRQIRVGAPRRVWPGARHLHRPPRPGRPRLTHERGALPCRGLHPLLRAVGHPRVVNGRRHPLPLHQLLPEGAALLRLDQDDEERPPTTLVANALCTHLNSPQPLEKRHTLSASGVLATIREFANRALVPHEWLLKSLAHHSILGRTCYEDDEVFRTSPPSVRQNVSFRTSTC